MNNNSARLKKAKIFLVWFYYYDRNGCKCRSLQASLDLYVVCALLVKLWFV